MSQRAFLYNLQFIDNQIDKILDRIASIDTKINSNQEIVESENILKSIQAKFNLKKAEISELESQSNILSKILLQNNNALYDGKIKNPKELQSVEDEGISLNKRIKNLEDRIFDMMLENELIEKELNNQMEIHQTLSRNKKNEIDELNSEKLILIESLDKLRIEKSPIEKQIKNELLEKYAMLRETRSKMAVAVISENACSACGNIITPAEIQKIKSPIDEYYCQICKRILYYN
ncbi:MAG: hypothetical protein CVU46_14470 [Chloroflexi bacterium HGW-Chloroflexi-8]|nr:MAG: hypothetical protein CVU46_14470 [Chloroflexi bacterium HGW-Chloroflexi-8]